MAVERTSVSAARMGPTALLPLLLVAAGASSVFYVVALSSDDEGVMRLANGSVPALLGVVCLYCGYGLVRWHPSALWTPLPWFLAAWAAYYGLGALSYVYATPETVAYMDALYPVDERALLRTNLLNAVGLIAVLLGAAFFPRVRLGDPIIKTSPHSDAPWRVALLFLAIGVPVKYLFELPYVLGLVDYVLPGSIQYLGTFSGLAIVPLTVAAAEGRRGARTLLWVVIAAEIGVGFVMLAKLHIIKTVLLVFLGQYAVRPNLKRFVVTGLVIAIAYVAVLSPFVNFARMLLGRASAQDVTELTAAASAYDSEGRETLAELLPGVQGWWARLAYSNAQAFAMEQYDQGKPGWTFGMAGYVFVPRFLHGDKPIMSPGIDFTYLIQGTDTSSTGLGFMGEAYWNGGWAAVLLVGAFVGGLFALLGRFSSNAVTSGRWLYTPLVFMAIFVGLRPDDWFVPTYIGGVLQVVLMIVLMKFAFGVFVVQRARRSRKAKPLRSIATP